MVCELQFIATLEGHSLYSYNFHLVILLAFLVYLAAQLWLRKLHACFDLFGLVCMSVLCLSASVHVCVLSIC